MARNDYTPQERERWQAQRLKAELQRGTIKPTPAVTRFVAKRRPSVLVADQPSMCFVDLRWSRGVAYATFRKGDQPTYEYVMTRAEFREWMDDPSLGGFFNDEVR